MTAKTQTCDKTTFTELQYMLVRHNYPLSYTSLLTVTAWGELQRMIYLESLTVNAKLCVRICHCEICPKWLTRATLDAIASCRTPHT